MATFTVRPEGIIRQPALTMPGNATGSEAACTSLTASQIRTLLSLGTTSDVTFDIVRATTSVLTPLVSNTASQLTLTGGPDAGYFNTEGVILRTASSATAYCRAGTGILYLHQTGMNPAYIYQSTNTEFNIVNQNTNADINLQTSGASGYVRIINNTHNGIFQVSTVVPYANEALTLGNSTYGVTVPGAAVVSGDISMSKTSAQGYLNLYSPDGTKLLYLFANNGGTGVMAATTNIQMSSASGSMSVTNNQIALSPTSGNAYVYVGGTNSTFDVYDSSGGKYSRLTHDGTNGILSTSSGPLRLTSAGTGFELRPAAGYIEQWTSGSDGQYNVYNSAGTKRIQLKFTGSGATEGGYITANTKLFVDIASTTGVMVFGQAGNSSDPGLKRGGSGILSARVGDDTADAAFTCAGITASGVVSHGAYTVATLPAAGSNAGKMAQVTDSNVAASGNYGATVAAGGANRVKVFSDGTNWVIA